MKRALRKLGDGIVSFIGLIVMLLAVLACWICKIAYWTGIIICSIVLLIVGFILAGLGSGHQKREWDRRANAMSGMED